MRIFSTRPDRETNSGRPPKRVLRKAYGAAKLDLYSRSHGVPHRQGARVNVSHDADAVRDVGAPPREVLAMMKFTSARFLFDAMDADQKDRVMCTFDLIRLETGFPNVRDAFVQAVDDEATAIEELKLLKQKVEGAA